MKHFSFSILLSLYVQISYSQSDSTFNLFFKFNEFHLSSLDSGKILSKFSENKKRITSINGFADTSGSLDYNLKLSEKRALSAYHFLLKKGLMDSSVTISFFGEEKSGNKYPYFDRRVEIFYESSEGNIVVAKNDAANPEVTEVYDLSNIFFKPNLAVVEPFSLPDIEFIAKYLKTLHNCRFEIVGHVNAPLSERAMHNSGYLLRIQKLSEDRAREIFNLLAENGIERKKMSTRGASNSQMKIENPKNEDEMRKNMRVEILIYCNKLP